MPSSLPWWTHAIVLGAAWALVLAAESARPLRRVTQPRAARNARNAALGALSLAVAAPLQYLLLSPVAELVARHDLGLLGLVPLPAWAHVLAGVLLLDATLWPWHWACHRVPFLWRFHVVHHADLDMDASTALRFHFGEHALSTLWRVGQVLLLGVSPLALGLWQVLLCAAILFHHGNLRLPHALERRLVHAIVTPRMHGIHHSVVTSEANSNFASLLSVWDRLFGTLRLNVPQDEVTIGVAPWRDPAELGLTRLLALPFGPVRPVWRSFADRPSRLETRPPTSLSP